MIYDEETLLQIFDLFISGLKMFSSDFDIQYKRFERSDIADDLANGFGEVEKERAKILFNHGWITETQYKIVSEIDEKLDEMSENRVLWDNEALKNSHEWQECREMGLSLLASLGY